MPSDPKPRSDLRAIWAIAWPGSLSMLLFTSLALVDLKWISFLGTAPLAAVSLCTNIVFVIFGLSQLVYAGTLALVARALGAGDPAAAEASLLQALILAGLLGILITGLGYLLTPGLIAFFELEPETARLSIIYLRLLFYHFFFMLLATPIGAAFNAAGNTRTPLFLNGLAVVANVVLAPIFIYRPGEMVVLGSDLGRLGLGISGAGLATVAASVLSCLGYFSLLPTRFFPLRLPSLPAWSWNSRELGRIIRVGVPASIANLSRPLSTVLLQKLLAGYSSGAIAGFGIGLRWLGINWIFFGGLGLAVSALCGQHLGAGSPRRAQAMVRRAFALAFAVQAVSTFAYYALAAPLVAFMDPAAATLEPGVAFLRWISVSLMFSTVGGVGAAALAGAGDTKPLMLNSIFSNWLVKLPLAWVLARTLGLGLTGIWAAMAISLVVEGVINYLWYRTGSWQRRVI
jgi:putative MATE family efflux protein